MTINQKNRRTGIVLTLIAVSLFVYSFFVVRHRGLLAEPANLTPAQKILRDYENRLIEWAHRDDASGRH